MSALTESGNPWIGRVPAHWTVTRFGRDMSVNEGQVDPTAEPWASTVLIAPNHIEPGTGRLLGVETAREQGADSGKYIVHAGQVIYSKIRPALNKATIASSDALCSADMYPISGRPDSVNQRFLLYWMLARPFVTFASLTSDRVKMPKINREELATAPWVRPPLDEQRQIADFLDAETAQIDTLIAEQERLIELLKERRVSGVFQAVTRGTQDVELKPSTLTWVDAVPTHWTVANIRRFAAMKTGHTPSRSNPEYWADTHIPWFTLADVWQLRDGRRTYLGETENTISDLGLASSAAELLPAGTVVLSRTASVGFSGVMPRPMATSQDFWNWVCTPALVPEYLMYLFRAMRGEFNALMIGSTHKTIYQPVAAAIRIPVPPVDEQRAIVNWIDERISKIDALIDEAERNIALSKERRAALIAASVTGQIDVWTGRAA